MSTFQGLAVPIYSDTGIELISISSTGGITFNEEVTLAGGAVISGGLTLSGSGAASVGLISTVSSTLQRAGLHVNMTSTGAVAALATLVNGIVVTASSKAASNTILMYDNTYTGGVDQVSSAISFLGINGTKAPTYFLTVSGSKNVGEGAGAAETNGFFSITHRFTSSIWCSTLTPFATLAVMSGSYVFYVPCYPNTTIT